MPTGLRTETVDARMAFQWRLIFPGINTASVKEVDLPDSELEEAKFSLGIVDEKQPGRLKVGDMTIKRVLTSMGPDLSVYAWHLQCGDPNTGIAAPASTIRRDGSLVHLNGTGIPIETVKIVGAWPKKISGFKLSGSSEVTMEEVVFSVRYILKVPGAG